MSIWTNPSTLIGAGAGFAIGGPAGAAVGAGMGANMAEQEQANAQSWDMMQAQQAFQENMSNTAHVREAKDLKLAGLNPILSANAGASTPSGGMGSIQAPQIDMPSIINAMNMKTQLDQGQQKINIDKANSAAIIAKNLSGADVDRANALATRQGVLSHYLGTDTGSAVKSGFKNEMNNMIQQKKGSSLNPIIP